MQGVLDLEPQKLACVAGNTADVLPADLSLSNCGLDFRSKAMAHILSYLRKHGISSAEMLTDSCKLAGIKSGDDRHFGVVYRTLLAERAIYWAGPCRRAKGHASHGGSMYALERP